MSTRWEKSSRPRAEDYDGRWQSLSAAGQNIHGEADLVEALLRESGGSRVLDAGCGTGRVAIELAARGFSVTGVDADAEMLAIARDKAPDLTWITADLADLGGSVDPRFDLVVLAGNVMIFLDPGTEERVLRGLAARLSPGALLVAGFQLRPDRLTIDEYDRLATAAGLESVARWSTWTRDPFSGGEYAVSVHRRPDEPS
jgi:SAM-dependent methyltransferase